MTETPKTNLHINPDKINYSQGTLKMTKRKAYKVNPEKLKGAPQSILPYVFCFPNGTFYIDEIIYYSEDYEHFDLIKPYLDIND